MRILFVGMPDNIHSARWISQIADLGWEIYFFPTYISEINPMFKNITYLGTSLFQSGKPNRSIRFSHWPFLFFILNFIANRITRLKTSKYKEVALKYAIKWIKPDIVHSLELQLAGYMTLGARNQIKVGFPTWIATNWGSDIYLFGRLDEHKNKIKQILETCDYYSCECQRDVTLAYKMGLKAKVLPIWPNAGGLHLENLEKHGQPGPVSKRKIITLKGYQHWAGRALVAFQAFRLCKDDLDGYSIAVFSASDVVKMEAQLFEQDTGIKVDIVPFGSHDEILNVFGKSRLYIGLSISDGISTSMLEAMAMGAFPIQSCTACADEWIECGISGYIVPPEDPQEVSNAIRRALADDSLVDRAAEINAKTVHERLDFEKIQSEVIEMYEGIFRQTKLER